MARPDNRRDDCPAFLKPDRKALRTLKQPGVGDVGFRVRYDSRERPVFYVWQCFTWVRLRLSEARMFARMVREEDRKYRQKNSPNR
jgi:hypothetical protein